MTTETELRARLRESGDAFTAPAVTAEQIVRRAVRRRRQRRLTIAGLATVVLLGVVGLAALAGGTLNETDHNPNRIETVDDGEDGLPLPESTGPILVWERLDETDDEFRLATWHRDEFEGAFYATVMDDLGVGRLLSSSDGSDWHDLGRLPFPLEQHSLVSGDGNLYALENIDQLLEDGGDPFTPVWLSPDNAESWELFESLPGQTRTHHLKGQAVVSMTSFNPATREAEFTLLQLGTDDDSRHVLDLVTLVDEVPAEHEYQVGWVSSYGRTLRYSIETVGPPETEGDDLHEGDWLVRESPDGVTWAEAGPIPSEHPRVLAGPGGLMSVGPIEAVEGTAAWDADQRFAWSSDNTTWGWDRVKSAFGANATDADFVIGGDSVLALVADTDGDRRLFRAPIPDLPTGPEGPDGEAGVTPQEEAAAVAELTGARTVIQAERVEGGLEDVFIWSDGASLDVVLQAPSSSWADHDFIYTWDEDGTHRIFSHEGALVCETGIDGFDTTLHHATERDDGSIVLGISEWTSDDVGAFTAVGWAQDCESGERVAIEPMYRPVGEAEFELVERAGGRTFVLSGDAEGNVGRIEDESGRNIITGDDYVGITTFSRSGATVVYGEHRNSVSPHVTNLVEARSTRTTELLLSWQAPEQHVVCGVHVVDDEMAVVVHGSLESSGADTCLHQEVTAIDLATGVALGTLQIGAADVLYIG